MSVSIIMKKIMQKTYRFENHLMDSRTLEEKIHYINGLALIMNEDDVIHIKEKEYLSILINTFDLDISSLDEVIDFSINPNEASIAELLNSFSDESSKWSFIIDSIVISYTDGKFDEAERSLVTDFLDLFEIDKKQFDLIEKIIKKIIACESEEEIAELLCDKRIDLDFKYFIYLFKYYKLDMDKISNVIDGIDDKLSEAQNMVDFIEDGLLEEYSDYIIDYVDLEGIEGDELLFTISVDDYSFTLRSEWNNLALIEALDDCDREVIMENIFDNIHYSIEDKLKILGYKLSTKKAKKIMEKFNDSWCSIT